MCGIAGYWNINNKEHSAEALRANAELMNNMLRERGPDSSGIWSDASAGVALAHRRLGIIDLSEKGHQPMQASSRRFTMSYNGEVYNFSQLRRELEAYGHAFVGNSDTEVLLAGFLQWGIPDTFRRCIGMFACAIFDQQESELTLVRDRVGIKPLYYGRQGGLIAFASQPKAVIQHPDWQRSINRQALAEYVAFNYVPAPLSIYQDLEQVMPGQIVRFSKQGTPTIESFWDIAEIDSRSESFTGSDSDAVDQLEALLKKAVGQRMISDVPLGAFLSGGVDSSTVVALMQAQSQKPVQTFSIGFHEKQFDEAIYAKKIAEKLGTRHTQLYVSGDSSMDVIPDLASFYDEPFSDVSQIPQMLVCELTRRHVTVALSGDGGDELFAGYNRYLLADKLRKAFLLPRSLRKIAGSCILGISSGTWDRLFSLIDGGPALPGDKLHKLARILNIRDFGDVYAQLVSGWFGEQVVLGAQKSSATHLKLTPRGGIKQLQRLDMQTYLPNDILQKVDRASMAYSLEARVPLLDHRVIEFAWSLPESLKIRNGQSKWVLRQVLYRHLPQELIERPKMGFAVPIGSWLRGPLRDWVTDLLSESSMERDGLLNTKIVQTKLQEHLSGKRNWQYQLWNVLMFQAWKQKWIN